MKATAVRLFPVVLVAAWAIALVVVLALPDSIALDDRGDLLIRGTVRLALLYWTIAVALMLRSNSNQRTARLAWTLACAAYLVHVGMAFEYAHNWSHAAAFAHVKQAGGFGEGIFVNYFFTLLWTADAVWWYLDRRGYENRPRWLGWAIHGFMVFMIANGVIIFENGAIRWLGVVVLLGLGWLFWRRISRKAS
jgi:hypothetical protein